MKLSDAQLAALSALSEGPLDDCAALVRLGSSRRTTLESLQEEGPARFYPYGGDGVGLWRITPDGRERLTRAERRAGSAGR